MNGGNGHNGNVDLSNETYVMSEACENCEVCVTINCQSCGMPMTCPQEHGGGDNENVYCARCCNDDGSLKNYEEVVEYLTQFMMETKKLDRDSAEKSAKAFMSMLPAWEGR